MGKSKYQVFLDNIDELSKERLERIDVILEVNKYKFMLENYELSETDCISGDIQILRNDKGFYVREDDALNSKVDYDNYLDGVAFFKKHNDEFKIVHNLLLEKELIMDGYYHSDMDKSELNNLVTSLGYGCVRSEILNKRKGKHPSNEFRDLMDDLNILDKTTNKEIIKKMINEYFKKVKDTVKENHHIELKNERKKYDTDFDNYMGVAIYDDKAGVINLLYGSDGFDISKNLSEKFVDTSYPFLEVYLKIITKGLFRLNNID